jgi:hypothetical protein
MYSQRINHLDIGFECWLLDIQISRSPDTFSDGVELVTIEAGSNNPRGQSPQPFV